MRPSSALRLAAPLSALILIVTACGGDGAPSSNATTGGGAGGETPCPARYAECDGDPHTVCESRIDSDPDHCGGCSLACPTGGAHQNATCIEGVCGLVCALGFTDCDHDPATGCEEETRWCGTTTLVADLSAPIGLVVDEAFVYYGSRGTPPDYPDGKIYKVPKAGGKPVLLAEGLNLPLNMAIDAERLYWTNAGHFGVPEGSVVSLAKGAAQVAPTVIAAGLVRPGNPVIVGDRLFWTVRDLSPGRVLSAHKDGSDPAPTVVAEGVMNPSDLEPAAGTLVWASRGDPATGVAPLVERAALDGSQRVTLATGIAGSNYQLGVAPDAVFVGSFVDGMIHRVPFDLAVGPSVITKPLGDPQEIVVDGARLFVTTGKGLRVLAVPLVGGEPTVIADDQLFPSYLAMDDESIYWTDGALDGAVAAIRKAKKPAP